MRLLIVSNRLPINVVEKNGELSFQQSPGGLVSGISAYLDSLKGSPADRTEYVWIGWPGVTVRDEFQDRVKRTVQTEFHSHPVFLSEEAMDKFYHGFCNKIIWPLFHYFPTYAVYDDSYWEQYREVNEIFCQAVLEILRPGDVVWVHDYHLMLLPQLLRAKIGGGVPIGFFLHIPFPTFEIFRLLPTTWGKAILEGLLGADLVGFHTNDYTQHFVHSIARLLGYEHKMGTIKTGDRLIAAGTFPMGIDYCKFAEGGAEPEVRQLRRELSRTLSPLKVLLSIDRLDYSKGIVNRLKGYRLFLELNPTWQGRVVLLLQVVPSRIGVEHYQLMKRQIDELVGEINGHLGSVTWTPVLYQYKFLPLPPLLAAYSISDIALITPLRDGMNLIAKEYLATRQDQTGVLILSEMAGAVHELGEAIIINPNNIEEIADAVRQALEMPVVEQKRRNSLMQERLRNFDVVRWSDEFMHKLLGLTGNQERIEVKYLSAYQEDLCQDFAQTVNRLLLLDYDGTLAPFEDEPQAAASKVELLDTLHKLAAVPGLTTVVISGRDRNTLDQWLGTTGINLVAEHGAWLKQQGEWRLSKAVTNDWKTQIISRLQVYCEQLSGSFLEEKEFGVSWHYRKAEAQLGNLRAKEVMDDLITFTANMDVQVLVGNKVIEVRPGGINKGLAAWHWLSSLKYDFVLAVGDDHTDEDMFAVLPLQAYSIKVGFAVSRARYYLHNYKEVLDLLGQLADNG